MTVHSNFKALFFAIFVVALLMSFTVSAQGLEGLAQDHDDQTLVQPVETIEPESGVTVLDDGLVENVDGAASSDPSYVLGADDVIKVTVYGENDLSSVYKIGGGGLISFPLIGEVEVQGKTTRQVEAILREKLSDGYLINPGVSVEMASYRPFYILGEVRQPGSYDFTNGVNVLKAVAQAGGFTYRANKKEVQILRTKNSDSGLYDKVPVNTSIGPGDIILVKERFF